MLLSVFCLILFCVFSNGDISDYPSSRVCSVSGVGCLTTCANVFDAIPTNYYTSLSGCTETNLKLSVKEEPNPSGADKFYCNSSTVLQEICETTCLVDLSPCDGDTTYCSNYNCTVGSSCYCVTVKIGTELQIFVDSFEEVTDIDPAQIAVNGMATTFSNKNDFFTQNSVTPDSGTNAYLDDKNIIVTTINPNKVYVILYKGNWVQTINMTLATQTILIPDVVYSTSGYVNVDVYFNGQYEKTIPLAITGTYQCRLYDCILCENAWTNWKCLPATWKFWFILWSIIGILLLCLLLPATVYIFYILLWCILKPWGIVWSCGRGFWKTRIGNKLRKKKQETEESITYWMKDEEEMKETSNIVNRNKGTPLKAALVILAIAMLPLALADCDSFATVTNPILSCSENLCNVSFSAIGNLGFKGDSACLAMGEGSSSVVIEITHLGVTAYYNLIKQYFTSDWVGSAASQHRCYKSGASCESGSCENYVYNFNNKNGMGQIVDGQVLSWPGETYCRRGNGCAGNGCFYCTDGCIWSSYGIVPLGEALQIDAIGVQQWQAHIKINVTTNSASKVFYLNSASTFSNPDFKLTITGLSVQPVETFTEQNFIRDIDGDYYLYPTSKQNVPVAGSIGDIQASYANSFLNPDVRAFLKAPNIATPVPSGKYDVYSFQPSGVKQHITSLKKFPMVLNGNLWNTANGVAYSNLTTPGGLTFALLTNKPLSLTYKPTVVCPVASLTSASGCFLCSNGSIIGITARSSCDEGFVDIRANSKDVILYDTKMRLAKTDKLFSINIATSIAVNDFTIFIKGTTDEVELHVHFEAYDPKVVVDPLNPDSKPSVQYNSDEDSTWKFRNFLDDVFHGAARWWEYLLFVIFCTILIVIFIGLTILSVKIYKAFKNGKPKEN